MEDIHSRFSGGLIGRCSGGLNGGGYDQIEDVWLCLLKVIIIRDNELFSPIIVWDVCVFLYILGASIVITKIPSFSI